MLFFFDMILWWYKVGTVKLFELDKKNYERLLDSILQIPFNMLMARSVLSGHVNGRVFVDFCESPQSFYIIHPYGMTYLCGRSDNEDFNFALFDYFRGLSYPREKDEWIQAFPRDWDQVLDFWARKHGISML